MFRIQGPWTGWQSLSHWIHLCKMERGNGHVYLNVNMKKMNSKMGSGELESDRNQTLDTMMEHDSRSRAGQMGSGIEWEMKHVHLGFSTKT